MGKPRPGCCADCADLLVGKLRWRGAKYSATLRPHDPPLHYWIALLPVPLPRVYQRSRGHHHCGCHLDRPIIAWRLRRLVRCQVRATCFDRMEAMFQWHNASWDHTNCTAVIASTQDSETRGSALGRRALAYYQRGEYEKSMADYTQAIALNPRQSSRFVGLCLNYAKMKADDRALANCNEAVRLDPQSTNALLNRAFVHSVKRNYESAIADYDRVIRLDAKSAMAFYNRGIAYQAKGDDEHAIADYSEAIRLKPDYAEAYGARGVLKRRKGDFFGSAEDLAKFNSLRAK